MIREKKNNQNYKFFFRVYNFLSNLFFGAELIKTTMVGESKK